MLLCGIVSCAVILSGFVLPAWSAETCSPVLAGMMPKGAVHVSGKYTPSGMISMGSAGADLPFENICANQTTKYPGRVTFDVQHYTGDGVEMLKMQVGMVEEQALQDEKKAFEKSYQKMKKSPSPSLDSVSPVKEEKVKGGTIIYYDYYTDCSEGEKRSKPTVKLFGVAHTESTRLTLNVNGSMSKEAARAAAVEVMENFSKAKF
jgi:hypothetical protein